MVKWWTECLNQTALFYSIESPTAHLAHQPLWKGPSWCEGHERGDRAPLCHRGERDRASRGAKGGNGHSPWPREGCILDQEARVRLPPKDLVVASTQPHRKLPFPDRRNLT